MSSYKLIYIAGPFRAPSQWGIAQNVRRAEEAFAEVVTRGFGLGLMPVCVHTQGINFHGVGTEEYWLDGTMEVMRRCDAVLMVDGWQASKGACQERLEANRLEKPVFTSVETLIAWAQLAEAELAWVKDRRQEKETGEDEDVSRGRDHDTYLF